MGSKLIHPLFTIERGGDGWFWNRPRDEARDRGANMKLRFGFEDLQPLDEATPLLTKIRRNQLQYLPFRYAGVIYGKDRDRDVLEAWGERFPYAELIIGLDRDGKTLAEHVSIRIK